MYRAPINWRADRGPGFLVIALLAVKSLLLAPPPVTAAETVEFDIELIAEDLVAPIDLITVADGSGRMLVLDQSGLIHWLLPDNTISDEPFADLRDRLLPLEEGFEERGLLGLALHPQFAVNGRLFVTYTAPAATGAPDNWNYTRYVSELTVVEGNEDRVDLNTERVLIEQHWPSRKHNGGALAFGSDGFLYIGFGDGGGIHGVGPDVLNDAFNVPPERQQWDSLAQDPESLFGKILRIDVDRGSPIFTNPYEIPLGNPFAKGPGRDEIYAWGFRNPYRIAFDPSDGQTFYVTAVAETLWEAVYQVDEPGNYGWPLREGTHCFDRQRPLDPPADCGDVRSALVQWPIRQPVVEYPNMSVHREGSRVEQAGIGTAVVGALMLMNSELTALNEKLLVADWSLDFRKPSGQLFSAQPKGDNSTSAGVAPDATLWPLTPVTVLKTRIVALSQDDEGRVYLLTNDNLGPYGSTGKVYRLKQLSP